MKPELQSVRAIAADENTTKVEIIYKTASEMTGIELHGVDAGLSWLKGESFQLEKINYTIYIANYKGILQLTNECEFRGRAFDDNEDHWESHAHRLRRSSDGSINLVTTDEIINSIKFTSKPPKEYVPELFKIKLIEVKEKTSICEIIYKTSEKIEGLELHGVDGGLSWLKGQSLSTNLDNEDNIEVLKASIEIDNVIEFKARAYREDKDFWEEGANHKIERMSDGTISFTQSPDDQSLVNLVNRLEIVYDLSIEDSLVVLKNQIEIPVQFLQYLVCVNAWYIEYIKDPFDQDLFDLISFMTRYIRENSRKQKSQKIDDLVLPVIKSLYAIYTEAISFMEEDTSQLVSIWKGNNVLKPFEELIDNIKRLETDGFGDENDRNERERTLSAYN